MPQKTISIIGCGWLGLPLAEHLLTNGYSVKGSTTTAEKVPVLRQKGIDARLLRLIPEPEGDLSYLLQADVLVVNVPPKAGKQGDDFHPIQLQLLTEAIRLSAIQYVIYVSTTSIYPELNRVVVEDDVVQETQSVAPALVRAERYVQTLSPGRSVTILRCGGLLGYERIPGKYVAGRTVETGAVPVNYLHRDDAVELLAHLVEYPAIGVFNAVSPDHPTRESVYRQNCADFGFALPTFAEPAEPVSYKVISPDKLINTTNYAFRYPDPLAFFYAL